MEIIPEKLSKIQGLGYVMIFDSDEQRKAVFASLMERGEFRDMYRRSRRFRSEIKSLDSQIQKLRYDRGTLKREIY